MPDIYYYHLPLESPSDLFKLAYTLCFINVCTLFIPVYDL